MLKKVKGVEGESDNEGWLIPNNGGDYTNVSEDDWRRLYSKDEDVNWTNPNAFETDTNGSFEWKHIERGRYEIWEVYTFGIEFDITEQLTELWGDRGSITKDAEGNYWCSRKRLDGWRPHNGLR